MARGVRPAAGTRPGRKPRGGWRGLVGRIPWQRLAAGGLAGGSALLLTFFLRLIGWGLFLPEIAVDFVVTIIPGQLEAFFISTMGAGAKMLALAVAVAVIVGFHAVPAAFFRWVQARVRVRWGVIAVYAGGIAAGVLLVALPLMGFGPLGSGTTAGIIGATASQGLAALLYASVLDTLLVDVAARYPAGFKPSRRQFIAIAAVAVLAGAALLYGFGSVLGTKRRLSFRSVAELLAGETTPNGRFYVVSKNVSDPIVPADTWRLRVDGLVDKPVQQTLTAIEGRPLVIEDVTLICVSNEVGGDLIGTARWEGVPLAELINEAGPKASADWVAFHCADGYSAGLPLSRARDPRTMLAIRMNGEPLAVEHGAPARIIVPGRYGMFHAKWVRRIELVSGPHVGFWQQKGWTNKGEIKTTAIIATPAPESVVRGTVTVGGIAFAGIRGTSRVEVSTDGGASWADATILPPLSDATWVLWTYDWTPLEQRRYRLTVRATDGRGTVQTEARAAPFPDGASGWDSIDVRAA